MPRCLNDPKRNYTGKEPSPKGLGYCAHNEKKGIIRLGKDGNAWIVSESDKKIKKWTIHSKNLFLPLQIIKTPEKVIKSNDKRLLHLKKSEQVNFLKFINNKSLVNDLKDIGVTLFYILFSDHKFGDKNNTSSQYIHINQERDEMDWDDSELRYQKLTEKYLDKPNDPYLLAVIEYDSVKNQFLDKKRPIIYFNSNIGYYESKKYEKQYHYSLVKPVYTIFKKYYKSKYSWNEQYFDIPMIKL